MSAKKESKNSSWITSEVSNAYLSPEERGRFCERLFSQKEKRSLDLLALSTGVHRNTLSAWYRGGRIRRSVAEKVDRNLGFEDPESNLLEQVAREAESAVCPKQRRLLIRKAALILAGELGDSAKTLLFGPPLVLQLDQAEVLIAFNKDRLCYCLFDKGERKCEGDYSRQTPSLIREFLRWKVLKMKDHETLKKAIQDQNARFQI